MKSNFFFRLMALCSVSLLGACVTPPIDMQPAQSVESQIPADRYAKVRQILNDETLDADAQADKIASLGSGYIPLEFSPERLAFQREFPVQTPSQADIEKIQGILYQVSVIRTLSFSADIDKRTSGRIQDASGNSISVSGLIDPSKINAIKEISNEARQSTQENTTRTIIEINTQNQTHSSADSSVIINSIGGAIGGLIVDWMTSNETRSSIEKILSKNNFGERMELGLSSVKRIGSSALPNGKHHPAGGIPSLAINSRIFRHHFLLIEIDNTKSKDHPLVSVTALFRGKGYAEKYPSTYGWEFIISNLNSIQSHAENSKMSPEEKERSITEQLKTILLL